MKRYDVLNDGTIHYCDDGAHVKATEAQAEIDRLLSHIRQGFEEGDEKAQKEYQDKSIEILQEYSHKRGK